MLWELSCASFSRAVSQDWGRKGCKTEWQRHEGRKKTAMTEGACLSPQPSMCLSVDLCVCLCLRPQVYHFRNTFHIFAVVSISKSVFDSLINSLVKGAVCPNSIDFCAGKVFFFFLFFFKRTVITWVCDPSKSRYSHAWILWFWFFGLRSRRRLRLLLESSSDESPSFFFSGFVHSRFMLHF